MQEAVRHVHGAAGSKNTFHRMVNDPERIFEPEYVRGFVVALGLDDQEAAEWEQRRRDAVQLMQASTADRAAADEDRAMPPQARATWWRSRRFFAAAVLLILCAAGIPAAVIVHRMSVPARLTPGDGSDPVDNGCSLDPNVMVLDNAEVDYRGKAAGSAQLLYSPRCGVAWPRFKPFPAAEIPSGTMVHVDVVRPADKSIRSPFEAAFAGEWIYGNVLRSTEHCVYAAVSLGDSGTPESRTHCFRGRTASDVRTG